MAAWSLMSVGRLITQFTKISCRSFTSKTLEIVVSSLRVDRILATGLGLGRKKIELSLLAGNIYVNRTKVEKKSTLVVQGDTIDLLEEINKDISHSIVVSRVLVVDIGQETRKGKHWVNLERSKHISVPIGDYRP